MLLAFDPLSSDIYLGPRPTLRGRVQDWLAARGFVQPRTLTISAEGVHAV